MGYLTIRFAPSDLAQAVPPGAGQRLIATAAQRTWGGHWRASQAGVTWQLGSARKHYGHTLGSRVVMFLFDHDMGSLWLPGQVRLKARTRRSRSRKWRRRAYLVSAGAAVAAVVAGYWWVLLFPVVAALVIPWALKRGTALHKGRSGSGLPSVRELRAMPEAERRELLGQPPIKKPELPAPAPRTEEPSREVWPPAVRCSPGPPPSPQGHVEPLPMPAAEPSRTSQEVAGPAT